MDTDYVKSDLVYRKRTLRRWREMTMTRTKTTAEILPWRGRQSDTMDFEECNFRRHNNGHAYLPTAPYNLIVRARGSNFPRVMGILALATRRSARVSCPRRDRRAACFFLNFKKFYWTLNLLHLQHAHSLALKYYKSNQIWCTTFFSKI